MIIAPYFCPVLRMVATSIFPACPSLACAPLLCTPPASASLPASLPPPYLPARSQRQLSFFCCSTAPATGILDARRGLFQTATHHPSSNPLSIISIANTSPCIIGLANYCDRPRGKREREKPIHERGFSSSRFSQHSAPSRLRRNLFTAQYRTGQDRTGQDRTGQDRTGQDRTGQ